MKQLIKRVRQIANEIDADFIDEYNDMSLDGLAFRLKIIASSYNCFINSWVTRDWESTQGVAECYCTVDYQEENEDTWELFAKDSEPLAIIFAFKWLADRGYFVPENKYELGQE